MTPLLITDNQQEKQFVTQILACRPQLGHQAGTRRTTVEALSRHRQSPAGTVRAFKEVALVRRRRHPPSAFGDCLV